jgi:two-component system LytT family response regulator
MAWGIFPILLASKGFSIGEIGIVTAVYPAVWGMGYMQQKVHRFHNIAIPTIEGFELVPAAEIEWCEAEDNYTHLHLKDGRKITACRTLREVEEQLKDYSFFLRVHHSYMVNLNEIARYIRGEGGYLVMNDGVTINVSRSRKESLMQVFDRGRP